MTRTLKLSEEGADEFILAMLKDDLESIELERVTTQHPEDKKYCKKMRKALIRVINHFSTPDQKLEE